MDELIKSIRSDMKSILKESRYEHTLGVAYTAANLAMCYGVSMEDALIAGLLHDNAKYVSDSELIQLCEDNHMEISEIERKHVYLLHSKAGAVLAQRSYDIQKEDILNAIIYHTTGRPGMSVLEKIIFIADYIEPNRKSIPNLEKIRKEAYRNLDKTVAMILSNTLNYLMETKGKEDIDPATINSYEYYKQKE